MSDAQLSFDFDSLSDSLTDYDKVAAERMDELMRDADRPIDTLDIFELRDEAGQAGDTEMVKICNRALEGAKWAHKVCSHTIISGRKESLQR